MASPTPKRGEGLDETLYDEHLADDSKIPRLDGKVVAITGTTTGLGAFLTRMAVVKGAKVVLLLNRESGRSKEAEKKLREYNSDDKTIIETVPCDLMDFASVGAAADRVNAVALEHGGLDCVAFNAGIMMMGDDRTKDGFDVQMQTNQLSHALLMHRIWNSLEQAEKSRGEARVVFQSSSMRSVPGGDLDEKMFEKSEPNTLGGNDAWVLTQFLGWSKGPISRYHQTKLANSAFGIALHKKLQAKGSKIKSIICEPGYSVTPLQTTSSHLPAYLKMLPTPRQSAANGSLNAVMACFATEAQSGDFYVPEKGLVGPPVKVISAGEPVKKGGEKLTCSDKNQKVVWDGCQNALGIEFAV